MLDTSQCVFTILCGVFGLVLIGIICGLVDRIRQVEYQCGHLKDRLDAYQTYFKLTESYNPPPITITKGGK